MSQTKQQHSPSVFSPHLPSSIDRHFFIFSTVIILQHSSLLTLLILGIASLLASDVVLLLWTQTSLKAFISEAAGVVGFFCRFVWSFHSFSAFQCKAQTCWWSRLPQQVDCRFELHYSEQRSQILLLNSNSPDQITVILKAICCVKPRRFTFLSGQEYAGCDYQENWALIC